VKQQKTLLIVDDEPNIRRILQVAFEKQGLSVHVAEDARCAAAILEEVDIDAVLTDVTMPGTSGYELLRAIRAEKPGMPVVIMTAFGTIPQAIQAIRDGAFEYITKPFDLEHLKKVVQAALESEKTPARSKSTKKGSGAVDFLAVSEPMQEVLETVRQVADSKATVLVTGESGTGKEVVAKLIHELSPRAAKPFVAVSCAALPETLLESELFGFEKGAFTGAAGAKPGRFEVADHGTLFLDEVGEIPMSIQVKLLRVLQEREFERLGATKPTRVDVRLITATNRSLQEAVDEGIFRMDLMYRLQVVEICIPPLRERREDILPLAEHFLVRLARENDRQLSSISEEAQNRLLAYSWPGNVRELENTIERAVVLSSREETVLTASSLPRTLTRAA